MKDELIDEVNAIRWQMMEECGHDVKKLGELIEHSQQEDSANLVSHVPPNEPEAAVKTEG